MTELPPAFVCHCVRGVCLRVQVGVDGARAVGGGAGADFPTRNQDGLAGRKKENNQRKKQLMRSSFLFLLHTRSCEQAGAPVKELPAASSRPLCRKDCLAGYMASQPGKGFEDGSGVRNSNSWEGARKRSSQSTHTPNLPNPPTVHLFPLSLPSVRPLLGPPSVPVINPAGVKPYGL